MQNIFVNIMHNAKFLLTTVISEEKLFDRIGTFLVHSKHSSMHIKLELTGEILSCFFIDIRE